ncbi:MAG: hypothetical protein KAR05_12055 [Candidatus Omnitrophica bacterium]|nr:hypothetical protein [Candidatus Omnitrophota bacterium]
MKDNRLSQFIEKVIPKPKLQTYISDLIEVGYNQYGPTLGLEGVLTALTKVILIENIKIQLKYEKSEDIHTFGWFAFLPHEFILDQIREYEFKMPSKFMVAPKHPHNCNIIFSDHEHYAEMNPSIKRIKNGWRNIFQNVTPEQNINYRELLEKFKNSSDMQSNIEKLTKLCYWLEGEYFLTTTINSKNPNQTFEIKKTFSLSQNDVDQLKNNAEIIIADLCKLPEINYFYAKLTLSTPPSKK